VSNKHFIPPIIEQWIEKLRTENNKEMYVSYLETTRDAIDKALIFYKKKN
jgi:hypothetical protein